MKLGMSSRTFLDVAGIRIKSRGTESYALGLAFLASYQNRKISHNLGRMPARVRADCRLGAALQLVYKLVFWNFNCGATAPRSGQIVSPNDKA